MKINTVLGPIESKELGRVNMHEHIWSINWTLRKSVTNWICEEEAEQMSIDAVNYAKEYGFNTIVDQTIMDLGRDVEVLRRVSEKTGVNIICVTGYYHHIPNFFSSIEWMNDTTDEAIYRIMMEDIEIGMNNTDIKAGLIKVATNKSGFTSLQDRIFKMAAKAHINTGIPIVTHSNCIARNAVEQQDMLENHGVNLKRVLIGHIGDCNDIEYIESVLKRGSYIGLDRWGQDDLNLAENRIETMVTLIKRGWINQIFLAQDHPLHWPYGPHKLYRVPGANPDPDAKLYESFAPNKPDFWDALPKEYKTERPKVLKYLPERIFPVLKTRGITEQDLNTILNENPRRFFEGA